MRYLFFIIQNLILLGLYAVMKALDQEYELPKIKKSYFLLTAITGTVFACITNYSTHKLIIFAIYFGMVSYAAFTDYHTMTIYTLPSGLWCIFGIVMNFIFNGFASRDIKSFITCVIICVIITVCKVINVGDLELFVAIIPSLYFATNEIIYPFIIMLTVSSLLGVVFNFVKFIKDKESKYAMAPYIFAGYYLTMVLYGI